MGSFTTHIVGRQHYYTLIFQVDMNRKGLLSQAGQFYPLSDIWFSFLGNTTQTKRELSDENDILINRNTNVRVENSAATRSCFVKTHKHSWTTGFRCCNINDVYVVDKMGQRPTSAMKDRIRVKIVQEFKNITGLFKVNYLDQWPLITACSILLLQF